MCYLTETKRNTNTMNKRFSPIKYLIVIVSGRKVQYLQYKTRQKILESKYNKWLNFGIKKENQKDSKYDFEVIETVMSFVVCKLDLQSIYIKILYINLMFLCYFLLIFTLNWI